MTNSVRLTMAQATIRYLRSQYIDIDGTRTPLFAGVWAIFGHGNVAGLGEALYAEREHLPTYRAHNEQAMAHAAIAFAKASQRRRMMACTASAGPGSTNMVTAAALAHLNRLPVLFLPGDTFATRLPDPVLQQLEAYHDYTLTTNDCFRPVSRFFDRITRPEQLITSLPQALRVLTDPAECGPVTLAMPQDVQTMAWDYPESLFAEHTHRIRRQAPDDEELRAAVELIRSSNKPLLVAGGGVHYAGAHDELDGLVMRCGIPVSETQAGKAALPWDHAQNVGAIGVTGSTSANALAAEADLVIAAGTRLGDFPSGSRALLNPETKLLSINVSSFDAIKHKALSVVGDAAVTLGMLDSMLGDWKADGDWASRVASLRSKWLETVDTVTADAGRELPQDVEVVGAINRAAGDKDVVVCAAGGLPGDLQKFWRTRFDRGYHMEYGYSCMGYEIAGGAGTKMALPDSEVYVAVGDGSYLMLNSEIATSVMLELKLIIVVVDNRGYGCIHRLQKSCGGEGFNNLLDDCISADEGAPEIDYAQHAASLGALSENVASIAELEEALDRARAADKTYVIAIRTHPEDVPDAGGVWWDVAVPEVSSRTEVTDARRNYDEQKTRQHRNL